MSLNDFETAPSDAQTARMQDAAMPLGREVLKTAEQYLQRMGSAAHGQLVQALRQLAQTEPYFDVLADQIEFESDEPIANDALNLLYFWKISHENEAEMAEFSLLDLIEKDYFQRALLHTLDVLQIGENLPLHRQTITQCLQMYQQQLYAGAITVLYGQIEGILTEALAERGYLQLKQTKYLDVYKIVPGLKGHEVKSLWHKVKIASDINPYFLELNALKMDNSCNVTAERHNIVHGSDLEHFTRERSFILFIWLFALTSFVATLQR